MSIQTSTYLTQDMDDFLYEQFKVISLGNEENYRYHYEDGNTYITKGLADTYPCVIAHTDTVHDIHKDFTVFGDNDIMFAMDMTSGFQVGVGGDDKVGIYVALEMLIGLDVVKVAFFRDEEHGCLGSREADMGWFKDVEFVLQCDRQGYKDFVNTIYGQKLFDKPFSNAIGDILARYGKKETSQGGLTDVYQLVENGLEVCVANMSCGYYRPHSDDEVIAIQEVFDTRDMVFEIVSDLGGKVWKNSLYIDYNSYTNNKPKKRKKGKKIATDWHQRSRDDWWNGEKSSQDETAWTKVSDREGYGLYRDHRSYNDFDELDAYEHMDLETCCSKCDTDEIMYDKEQDADWCFACDEYTNIYSHHILEEEVEDIPKLSNGMTVDEYEEWLEEIRD